MSDEETEKRILALPEWDREESHAIADDILCEILERLGYKKTVAAFKKMEKWYA